MGVFLWGSVIHATSLIIQEDLRALQKLCYTGRGVIVGVMDGFLAKENMECHGNEVLKFIRVVAPDAIIKTESILGTVEAQCVSRPSCLYELAKKNFSSFQLRTFAPCCVVVYKASNVLGKKDAKKSRLAPPLERYCASPNSYPDYTLCHFVSDEAITFKRNRKGDLFSFQKDTNTYCVRVDDLKEGGHFFWQFNGKELEESLQNVCAQLPHFEEAVQRLFQSGARIINASFTIPTRLEEKIKLFAQNKALLIKSAGNVPILLGTEEIEFSRIFDENQYLIDKVSENLQWKTILNQDISRHFMIVGQLDHRKHRCRESAMAGSTGKRYAGMVLDRRNPLSGTSFSTPQVTGLLALLQEAYPTIDPSCLSEALLATTTPLKGDEMGVEGGTGCVNPMGAFRAIYELYGVLPQGIEGRSALLPEGFEAETYLVLNEDLRDITENLSQSDRTFFAITHYLSHGKKEKRSYGANVLPKDFNANIYLYQYDDLRRHVKEMSWKEARAFSVWHYINRADTEKRTYKPITLFQSFCPELYLYAHFDLEAYVQGMDLQDACSFAYWHYSHYGHKEKRTLFSQGLSYNFLPINYLTLNQDVARCTKGMTSLERAFFSIWHYLNHGKKEARKYE